MRHLKTYNESFSQLDNPDDARVVISKVYNIVDEVELSKRLVDFIVEIDQFVKYADEYGGSFAGNRFHSLQEFKEFVEDQVDGIVSPLIYVAPFWFTRREVDITEFRDVYSDTIYIKIITPNFSLEEIDQVQKQLGCDECHLVKSKSGDIYLRVWWD